MFSEPMSWIGSLKMHSFVFLTRVIFTFTMSLVTSASKSSIRKFVITEKAPTRAFSCLKAATTTFTFKT